MLTFALGQLSLISVVLHEFALIYVTCRARSRHLLDPPQFDLTQSTSLNHVKGLILLNHLFLSYLNFS